MNYLYLDTSSNFLYTGIVKDNNLLATISEKMDSDLSRITLLKISEMFENTHLKPNDIDKIIVVNGPGSFTGIRVGITISKTFAWALKKEITTISSLDAMAVSSEFNGYKIPIIDARRGYVYCAIYDENNKEILEKSYISLSSLKNKIEKLEKNIIIITNDDIDIEYKTEKYNPNIKKIVEKFKDKQSIIPHLVNPDYLKLTEAEEKNRKQ